MNSPVLIEKLMSLRTQRYPKRLVICSRLMIEGMLGEGRFEWSYAIAQ